MDARRDGNEVGLAFGASGHGEVTASGAKLDAGRTEIARFLSRRPPFGTLAPDELTELVAGTELEFHLAGSVILSEDGGPVTFLRVIHSGAVDVVHEGRLLDLLGPGDTFGHAAMLSGLPPGFEARAAEDTLCYRIAAAVARPLLERARTRELAVSHHEPGSQTVGRLIRSATVRCDPDTAISEAARRITEAGASAAIVELPGDEFGILTDRDLRKRVVAADVPASAPVGAVMTAPAFTVTPDRLGSEVLFELLERGIDHAVVVSERGPLIGVVDAIDLFAVQPRSWFGTRWAIDRAGDVESLAAVVSRLPAIMVDLHRSSLRALEIARVLSALVDAVTQRVLALVPAPGGPGADGVVWVAVGSQARRELTPASRARGVLVSSEPPPGRWLADLGAALVRCGLEGAPVARSAREWAGAAEADGGLALVVLVDHRPLWGTPRESLPVLDGSRDGRLVDALAQRALATPAPTGFGDTFVLGLEGGRGDRLDIRAAAAIPIVSLGRWAGAAAGHSAGSTLDRLRAAAGAGVIGDADALTLADAFETVYELRIAHHMEQLAAGEAADDLLDPALMSPLTRDHLRDVFRAIAAAQRKLLK
ncbi:MAG TPA: putative nucleotidyltransferase substrate binding domain-containing protein [Solirubrobacteraceae bacterium]|nr:putative nucleotidyltransferase substrate binding domain-containing protein [Solirubrobacteraceae bacterium]